MNQSNWPHYMLYGAYVNFIQMHRFDRLYNFCLFSYLNAVFANEITMKIIVTLGLYKP